MVSGEWADRQRRNARVDRPGRGRAETAGGKGRTKSSCQRPETCPWLRWMTEWLGRNGWLLAEGLRDVAIAYACESGCCLTLEEARSHLPPQARASKHHSLYLTPCPPPVCHRPAASDIHLDTLRISLYPPPVFCPASSPGNATVRQSAGSTTGLPTMFVPRTSLDPHLNAPRTPNRSRTIYPRAAACFSMAHIATARIKQ